MTYPWAHLIDKAWDRFVAKLDARDPMGCWLWTGARTCGQGNTAPYGKFGITQKITMQAHVFICVAAGITVPGDSRDHLCGNTLCQNPLHIEPVTPRENSLRRWRSTPSLRRVA